MSAAETALPRWKCTKPSARRDIFLRAAEVLLRRKGELWHYCRTKTASTEEYFAFEFGDAVEALKSCAGLLNASTVQGRVPSILENDRSAMIVKEPYGVVLSIAPWNAPVILGLRSFLGPLASIVTLRGNGMFSSDLIQGETLSFSRVPKNYDFRRRVQSRDRPN